MGQIFAESESVTLLYIWGLYYKFQVQAKCLLPDHLDDTTQCRYTLPSQQHFYMETQVTVAEPQEDGVYTIHSSTQTLDGVQSSVARALGIPAHNIIAGQKACRMTANPISPRILNDLQDWKGQEYNLSSQPQKADVVLHPFHTRSTLCKPRCIRVRRAGNKLTFVLVQMSKIVGSGIVCTGVSSQTVSWKVIPSLLSHSVYQDMHSGAPCSLQSADELVVVLEGR